MYVTLGDFFPQGSGHVICLCGYENGSFLVKDPNTTDKQKIKLRGVQTREPLTVGDYNIWYIDANFVHSNIVSYYIYTI